MARVLCSLTYPYIFLASEVNFRPSDALSPHFKKTSAGMPYANLNTKQLFNTEQLHETKIDIGLSSKPFITLKLS